jgi:hypothetical protein
MRHDARLQLKIDRELDDRLRELAARDFTTVTAVVRTALARYTRSELGR